ncbi:MAG TPA: hypothetical protein ENN69_00870 [Spirochaetia bacterium]|nr:hypothetical protein [Spirochaetia bacterium]
MARYINEIATKKSAEELNKLIADFMQREGFKNVQFNGETVWKKGMGIMTGPQFIKTTTGDGKLKLEAWIKFALLPGVYVGEMGLNGFFGFALKKVLKGRVQRLTQLVSG